MRFGFELSTLLLNDVNRHSLYARVSVGHSAYWIQWWPRPIAGKRFLTYGSR